MTLAITLLIATPFLIALCAAITLDERYELTDRIAHTRLGQRVRALIDRYIDQ
jgi:hypothetical protein